MPKFLVKYQRSEWGVAVVEADNMEQALEEVHACGDFHCLSSGVFYETGDGGENTTIEPVEPGSYYDDVDQVERFGEAARLPTAQPASDGEDAIEQARR